MSSQAKRKYKNSSPIIFVAAFCVAIILALYFFDVPPLDFDLGIGFKYSRLQTDREGRLALHFIDVGQGDCIFIELPDNKNMIIDGGDGTKAHNKTLLDYLESRKVKIIDYCILTHSDKDHVGGLVEVINSSIDVLSVYIPYVASDHVNDIISNRPEIIPAVLADLDYLTVTSAVYRSFIDAVINEGLADGDITSKVIVNLEGIKISNGYYSFDFLMPTPEIYANKKDTDKYRNCVSPIILLKYNNKRVMLTGDSNEQNEKVFVNDYKYRDVGADVLKVAHHGSETSTSMAFLDLVNPDYAVICVGRDNSYGHPRQETLDRLKSIDCTVYRTDLHGTVVLTVSAEEFSFELAGKPSVSVRISVSILSLMYAAPKE